MYLLNWPHVYTQEGLSPCHLKKAKLMFFYARYPSSNTLKTYFPDVKVCVPHHVLDRDFVHSKTYLERILVQQLNNKLLSVLIYCSAVFNMIKGF